MEIKITNLREHQLRQQMLTANVQKLVEISISKAFHHHFQYDLEFIEIECLMSVLS